MFYDIEYTTLSPEKITGEIVTDGNVHNTDNKDFIKTQVSIISRKGYVTFDSEVTYYGEEQKKTLEFSFSTTFITHNVFDTLADKNSREYKILLMELEFAHITILFSQWQQSFNKTLRICPSETKYNLFHFYQKYLE